MSSVIAKEYQVCFTCAMKTQKVIEYFGSQAETARALNVKPQAVNQWRDKGMLPIGRAYQVQVITGGDLKVDPGLYIGG